MKQHNKIYNNVTISIVITKLIYKIIFNNSNKYNGCNIQPKTLFIQTQTYIFINYNWTIVLVEILILNFVI